MFCKRKNFQIKEAVNILLGGGLVIYPTETAYAIGCDAANKKAVDLIFKIKQRSKKKFLPLIASSLAMVKRYCRLSVDEEQIAGRYWPGPLTIVLRIKAGAYGNRPQTVGVNRRSSALAKGVMAKDGTVAIRVSSHPLARRLARLLGRPLVSTSANLSGEGGCYSIVEVEKQLKRVGADNYSPVLVIDGGRLKKRKSSTIVKMEKEKIRILRQGEIKIVIKNDFR